MSLSIYPHATLPSPTPTPTHAPTTVLFQGDVPPSVQRQIVGFSDFHIKDVGFARTTGQRLDLKEASVFTRAEDAKLQSRLVYEITVAQDMTNRQHTLHGGCAAFLVDVCSSVGLALLAMVQGRPADFVDVSQAIGARRSTRPRLWGRNSTSSARRRPSARARSPPGSREIWDVTHRRLCVSGVHNKMARRLSTPTPTPPEKAKL